MLEMTKRSAVTISGLATFDNVIHAPKDKRPFSFLWDMRPDPSDLGSVRLTNTACAASANARATIRPPTIRGRESLIRRTDNAGRPKFAKPRAIRNILTILKSS